jgi:predicted ATP-binding protein involved in virulence
VRIDHLTIKNFKGFTSCEVDFNSHFNLLVGDNATGKTSVLDALAIAVDTWFLGIRGDEKAGGIDSDQVRVKAFPHPDTTFFEKQFPSRIEARGLVLGRDLQWARELSRDGGRTTTAEAKELTRVAEEADQKVRSGEDIALPLICSYGTERLWYESRHSKVNRKEDSSPRRPSRFDGYRDGTAFEIQETALLEWIRAEVSASQQRGTETIALGVVRRAIVDCVENATGLYFDERYKEVIVGMEKLGDQMFSNLSDGQRIMLTLIGDLVKRAATLNPHFGGNVLGLTPGIVLIDELDLHLHPKWQRRVIHDLKRTFPLVQFIATTHSPQLIGEAQPDEIRILEDGKVATPVRSFGVDSSRILEEVMNVSPRNSEVEELLKRLSELIDKEDTERARKLLSEIETKLGANDPEVTGANTLINLLESTR